MKNFGYNNKRIVVAVGDSIRMQGSHGHTLSASQISRNPSHMANFHSYSEVW
jgi:hypothetical protein